MEGEGVGRLATVGRRYGPASGATPRGRGSSRKTDLSATRGGTTARGQRPQRCGTAADGGTSSRGVRCAAGNRANHRMKADDGLRTDAARQAVDATAKRGEPLPVPGCNKPGTPVRRKPSRWCETTRAERARWLGKPTRRWRRKRRREWTHRCRGSRGSWGHAKAGPVGRGAMGSHSSSESQERRRTQMSATAHGCFRSHPAL